MALEPPYRWVEHEAGAPSRPEHEVAVLALLARRQGHRAAGEWPLADTLLSELSGVMGILVDDRLKTWAWGAVPLAAPATAGSSRAAAAAAHSDQQAVVFVDTDGDESSLQLSSAGALQWWSGGRCFAKAIAGLVLCTATDGSGAETHTLSTSTGQPRARIPAAAVPTLLAGLTRITNAHAATLVVRQVAAGEDHAGDVRPIRPTAAGRGSKRKQESRRVELQARVSQLQPPADYASVSAPIAGMGAVLTELRSSVTAKCDSSSSGGPREPFEGIQWDKLPALLSMFGEGDEGNENCEGQDGTAARKRRRMKRSSQTAAGVQRMERKQRQCDAFAAAIDALDLPDHTLVADFGCGSCGLTLPLAWVFPKLNFCGIDIKKRALDLMDARASAAGLKNTRTHCGSVASFTTTFGLAIALHACGQASDEAMMQAISRRSPYLIAPCCVGKLKFSLQIRRDRSGGVVHTPKEALPEGGPGQEASVSELEREGMGFINRKLIISTVLVFALQVLVIC
jgi:SAM-dependent methyltransferase